MLNLQEQLRRRQLMEQLQNQQLRAQQGNPQIPAGEPTPQFAPPRQYLQQMSQTNPGQFPLDTPRGYLGSLSQNNMEQSPFASSDVNQSQLMGALVSQQDTMANDEAAQQAAALVAQNQANNGPSNQQEADWQERYAENVRQQNSIENEDSIQRRGPYDYNPQIAKQQSASNNDLTHFEAMPKDIKLAMQQMLAAVPLLRKMPDSQFQQAMPKLVAELARINPFLAEMVQQDGLTKDDLDVIEQGMNQTNQSVKSRGKDLTINNVSLPDGKQTVGRYDKATGEIYVKNEDGGFSIAPFGTQLNESNKNNKGEKANSATVMFNGKMMPLSDSLKNELQTRIVNSRDKINMLKDIENNFEADALTFQGKAKLWWAKQKDKSAGWLGRLSEEDLHRLNSQSVMMQNLGELLAYWVKDISGGNVTDAEFKRLQENLISGNLSPHVFAARIKSLISRLENQISLYVSNMKEGIGESERQRDAYKNIKDLASGVDLSVNSLEGRKALWNKLGKDKVKLTLLQDRLPKELDRLTQEKGDALSEDEYKVLEQYMSDQIDNDIKGTGIEDFIGAVKYRKQEADTQIDSSFDEFYGSY